MLKFSLKQPIFILSILFVSSSVFGQFSKGTLFIGPTAGTYSIQWGSDNLDFSGGPNSIRRTDTQNYSLSAGPQIGIFLTDHLVLGGSLGFAYAYRQVTTNTTSLTSVITTSESRSNNTTVNAGPFLRYYFFNSLSSNLIYAQVNTSFGTGGGRSTGNGINVNSTFATDGKLSRILNWNTGLSAGITHFFNPAIGLDISLGYSFNSTTSNNINNTNTESDVTGKITTSQNNYKETVITNGISVGIGFHWFIKR